MEDGSRARFIGLSWVTRSLRRLFLEARMKHRRNEAMRMTHAVAFTVVLVTALAASRVAAEHAADHPKTLATPCPPASAASKSAAAKFHFRLAGGKLTEVSEPKVKELTK
jgi:hypothetical protein